MSTPTSETRDRVQAGVREGGQFATSARAESAVTLQAPKPITDEHGFPTVECGRCKGKGRFEYSSELQHDRCFTCGGSGRTYERGLVADTVRAYAQAQMEASRPKVRQLRKGDLVTPIYHELAKANWARVTGVLVYPSRPTKWEGKGAERRPVEFEATISLDNGEQLRTTTGTIVARRGAQVDPAPFLAVLEQKMAHQQPVLTASTPTSTSRQR